MERDSDWYPRTRPKQRAMYANFSIKIDDYAAAMPGFLTTDKVARLKLICEMYIAIYDWLEQCESRLAAAYEFQREAEKGETDEPMSAPPNFESLVLPRDSFKGFVTEFRREIGLLKRQNGYTPAMGADLMIVAVRGDAPAPDQKQPAFKYEVRQGYRLSVTGSMQGMRAANFYYRRKGQNEWQFVGYLTRTPGEIHIIPAEAGEPENGEIKSIFTENNVEIGRFSDNREVTLS